ncbi:MAG TPA: hypothetical protein VN626_09515 [Clostridia bacterium]|nr:hypothetical protein [Clostridia bacterium]
MKKVLALSLATAMVLSMGAAVSAKTDDALYPVGSISESAYLYDSDNSAVDLANSVESVAYGKTLYYPLLNNVASDSSAAIAAAQAALAEKQTALTAANEAYNNAVTDASAKAAALEAAAVIKQQAQAVLDAAQAWNAGTGDEAAYVAALAAFDVEAVPAATAAEAVTAATTLSDEANTAYAAAETASNEADALVTSTEATVSTATAAVATAQTNLDTVSDSSFRYVYESEAVSGIKVKSDWDMNGKLVKSVEVTKKKVTGETLSQKYIYFLAITLAESTSTTSVDVVGTVEMRKSGSFDYEDMQLDVNMEVAYPVANDTIITEDLQIFKEGYGFIGDSEEEFTFECDDDSYFTVNTVGQSKLLISATTDFDSKIADLYPTANLNFFYGNGATFNKTGVLTLAADEGSYLYQVKDDGTMVRLNAEYDEYDEAFLIKTKTLGKYVVSDTALTIVNVPVNNGGTTTPTTPSNPSTGAAL